MRSIKLVIASLMIMAWAPFGAQAHSMTPGYEKKFAPGDVVNLAYTIKNEYDFPAIYRLEVYDKEGHNLEEGWRVDQETVKLFSGNYKRVRLKIKMDEDVKERKVLVCSVLHKVGYDEKDPTTISRVCSRLWLWR